MRHCNETEVVIVKSRLETLLVRYKICSLNTMFLHLSMYVCFCVLWVFLLMYLAIHSHMVWLGHVLLIFFFFEEMYYHMLSSLWNIIVLVSSFQAFLYFYFLWLLTWKSYFWIFFYRHWIIATHKESCIGM